MWSKCKRTTLLKISSVTENNALKENISDNNAVANLTNTTADAVVLERSPAINKANLEKLLVQENQDLKPEEAQLNFWAQNLAPEWNQKNNLLTNIKLNYPHWFNIATVALHALGSSLPSMPFIPKKISLAFRKSAILFSQWCIPFSKLHNFFEAWKGNRFYEAVARVLPNLFLPFLPFHNFQLAYGLSSGINVVHEHIKSRVGGLSDKDSMKQNIKKINDGLQFAIKDLFHGGNKVTTKERVKLGLTLGGGAAMILGAVPTLLFDRQGLNDGFAKFFGTIRSLGGFFGDLSITLFPSNPIENLRKKERAIGGIYLVPTFMDAAQRWMNQAPETNEIFNHFKSALNTIAELTWTHFSTLENHNQNRKKEKIATASSVQTIHKANDYSVPTLQAA